jgi:hypothetical protein
LSPAHYAPGNPRTSPVNSKVSIMPQVTTVAPQHKTLGLTRSAAPPREGRRTRSSRTARTVDPADAPDQGRPTPPPAPAVSRPGPHTKKPPQSSVRTGQRRLKKIQSGDRLVGPVGLEPTTYGFSVNRLLTANSAGRSLDETHSGGPRSVQLLYFAAVQAQRCDAVLATR